MTSWPGFALAIATTSFIEFTGSEGPIMNAVRPVPSIETQSNARSGSKGILCTAGFIVYAPEASSRV